MTVTFRYDDPQMQKLRVFLPGDFNNWGPNTGGVIAVGAPSQMAYDSSGGFWYYRVRLKVGQTYYYKIHFHLNASGTSYLWIADPLNPRLDGTQYGNSAVTIGNPMVLEPSVRNDSSGLVVGVRMGLFSSSPLTSIEVVTASDGIDATNGYRSDLGMLTVALLHPEPAGGLLRISVGDSAGRAAWYEFPRQFPPVSSTVPFWAADAVWYQIFPERFRNGDSTNDPTRLSLEDPSSVPGSWRPSPWTGDWYARDAWEVQSGSDFYNNGVFNRRYGGDLQGVLDELGYLDSLGITTLYFNPLFYARSLHKYDGSALQHIDPYFGPHPDDDFALMATETPDPSTWHWTSADTLFLRLLREAHQRGMRIVLDGVFDHSGRDLYAFHDLLVHQKNSAYRDWYTVYSFYDPAVPGSTFTYKSWYNYSSLPQYATTMDGSTLAPGPKDYIFAICKRWMDPNGDGDPSDGIDGWRLDTVPDVPIGFWTEWNTYIRSINPDIYTVAEIWYDASPAIVAGRFSATMNYAGCAIPIYDFLTRATSTPSGFFSAVSTLASEYGPDVALANQNLVDSHDTERLMSMIVNAPIATGFQTVNNPRASSSYSIRKPNDRERRIQRLVALAQMTIPGAPMVYYGDEAGMWGANDPDDRMPMTWPDKHFVPQATDPRGFARTPDDENFDTAVYSYYRAAIALRHRYTALRRGAFQMVAANDTAHTLAFTRSIAGETVLTVLNRDEQSALVTVPLYLLPAGYTYSMVFQTPNDSVPVTFSFVTGYFDVTLPPLSGAVFAVSAPLNRTVSLANGWNIISLPLATAERHRSVLFPHATSSTFRYVSGTGYVADDSLVPGVGYWIRSGSGDSSILSGPLAASDTVALAAGWNLIGGPSFPVKVHEITSIPPQEVTSRFFGYRGNYMPADSLLPGSGYWVQVLEPCRLVLTPLVSGSPSGARERIRISLQDGMPPPPPNQPEAPTLPDVYALSNAYPNPFNPTVVLRYALPVESNLSLKIYNALGQLVATLRDGIEPAGFREARWSGSGFASGIYFYRLDAADLHNPLHRFSEVRKMVFLK